MSKLKFVVYVSAIIFGLSMPAFAGSFGSSSRGSSSSSKSWGNSKDKVAANSLSQAKSLCKKKKYDTAQGPIATCTGGCYGPRYRYQCKKTPKKKKSKVHYVGLTSTKKIKGRSPYERAVTACKKKSKSYKKAKKIKTKSKCGKKKKYRLCYQCKK